MKLNKERLKKMVLEVLQQQGVAAPMPVTEAHDSEVKQAVRELEKQLTELTKFFHHGPWARLDVEKLKVIIQHIKAAYDVADSA